MQADRPCVHTTFARASRGLPGPASSSTRGSGKRTLQTFYRWTSSFLLVQSITSSPLSAGSTGEGSDVQAHQEGPRRAVPVRVRFPRLRLRAVGLPAAFRGGRAGVLGRTGVVDGPVFGEPVQHMRLACVGGGPGAPQGRGRSRGLPIPALAVDPLR